MANLTSTGRFAAGVNCANNDLLYGPYTSKTEANSTIEEAEMKSIGRTVGIQENINSPVIEYWYQPNDLGNLVLIEKNTTEETEPIPNDEIDSIIN